MNTKLYISVFLFLALSVQAYAQEMQLRAHHGYLAAHRQHMQHLIHTRTTGVTAAVERSVSGEKRWHHSFGMPKVGLTAVFIDWGNREQLGYGVSLFPHISFPLISGQSQSVHFKIGGGAGFITQNWNTQDNHKNTVFSSPAVIAIQAALPITVKLSPRLNAQAAISFTHMSNGATKLPNSGGNYLAGELGLAYSFWSEPQTTEKTDAEVKFNKPDISIPVHLSGFFKEGLFELTGRRPVGILSIDFAKRTSLKSSFQVGADFIYNGTLETVYTEQGAPSTSHINRMQYGITGGYHLILDSWEIYLKQGVYVHSQFYPNGRLYHRFGVRSYISEEWFFAAGIKSHFFVADFFEFGLGRALWKK